MKTNDQLQCMIAREQFPEKLYFILELARSESNGCTSEVVSWLPHGRAFRVLDVDRFMQDIVPMFFNQTSIRSFYRQLNLWGFKRWDRSYVSYIEHFYSTILKSHTHSTSFTTGCQQSIVTLMLGTTLTSCVVRLASSISLSGLRLRVAAISIRWRSLISTACRHLYPTRTTWTIPWQNCCKRLLPKMLRQTPRYQTPMKFNRNRPCFHPRSVLLLRLGYMVSPQASKSVHPSIHQWRAGPCITKPCTIKPSSLVPLPLHLSSAPFPWSAPAQAAPRVKVYAKTLRFVQIVQQTEGLQLTRTHPLQLYRAVQSSRGVAHRPLHKYQITMNLSNPCRTMTTALHRMISLITLPRLFGRCKTRKCFARGGYMLYTVVINAKWNELKYTCLITNMWCSKDATAFIIHHQDARHFSSYSAAYNNDTPRLLSRWKHPF